jgi:RND family efflux transporter MFP subunit
VWVEADIYEYELPWVKLGQKATMTLSYYPGKKYEGTITFINPFLEPKTRTVKIRLEFDNPGFELKPDMYANIVISSDIAKEGLSVPIQAVIHSGTRDLVIVDRGEGLFEPREVKVGAEAEGYYQILQGINEGEQVVTSAQFLIDSESNLKAAISMMQAPDKGEGDKIDPELDMSDLTMEDIETEQDLDMSDMTMKTIMD